MKTVIEKWYRKLSFPTEYDRLFEQSLAKTELDLPPNFQSYEYGKHTPEDNLLAFLYYCEELSAYYRQAGISEKILTDTLSDIVIWTKVWFSMKGELGLGETGWLKRHLSGKLFRLGRLQFCLGEFEKDYPEISVKAGDRVVEVHIPEDGKLSEEACDRSFALAEEFFKKYFPDFDYRFYSCHSWLLDGEWKRFLGENSNVCRFGKRFTEIDRNEDDAIIRYVFRWDATRENLGKFPAQTTLARAVLEAVERGERFREVLGVIPHN